MAGPADTITLSIALDAAPVTNPPLNSILIAGTNPAFSDRVRTYATAAAVLADEEAALGTSDYEYLAAVAAFSQSPAVPNLKIGRVDNSSFVAQVNTITVAAAADDGDYTVTVDGVPFTHAASGDTADVIAAALVALIQASTLNVTAAGATSPFTVTSDTAGDGFTISVNAVNNNLTLVETTPNTGWESEMALIAAEDDEFYYVVTSGRTAGVIEDVAKWAEANRKIYIAQSSETGIDIAEPATPDLATRLKNLSLLRTALLFYTTDATAADAAWAGKKAAIDPDVATTTWNHATLAGVAIDSTLTATQMGFIDGKNANVYFKLGGIGSTWEGKVADGNYIDSVVTLDWTYFRMLADLQTLFLNASNRGEKVPYTTGGITSIADVIRNRLRIGTDVVSPPHFNDDPQAVVTLTGRRDAPTTDIQNRIVRGSFQVEVAGAVHKLTLSGAVVTTLS